MRENLRDRREYQTVILAGLLHDIGKFLQRGSFGSLNTEGKHPKVSGTFVSAFQGLFAEVADVALLKTLVEHHHEDPSFRPDLSVQDLPPGRARILAYLTSQADNLSSSERGEEKATLLRHHPLPLTDTSSLDAIFPEDFSTYQPGEMNSLLTTCGTEFRRFTILVDKSNFDCVLTHLVALLHKYTWCIPSNTQEAVPDVSLFDHLTTTAAIAACLYQYHIVTDTLDEEHIKENAERFQVVVGDLSGIQQYIFDIATAGAGGVAKRLRARSLYIQLVTEVVCHRIFREISLPLTNIIMASGGKFYLLLPNTPQAAETVHRFQCEVDDWLLHELNGELALNLAVKTFGNEGFSAKAEAGTGFGKVLRDLSVELTLRKRHRFIESLCEPGEWRENAFLLKGFEGEQVCRSCGKFSRSVGDLCQHCQLDSGVGKSLPGAKYIAFFSHEGGGDSIPLLGYSVAVTSNLDFTTAPYLVLKLNNTNMEELARYPALPKYLANYIPRGQLFDCEQCQMCSTCTEKPQDSEEPAKFDCMANYPRGRPLLGFLKADVDNLGATFVYGLKRDPPEQSYDTISRLSTLSRQMDTFFNGWVEHLVSTEFTHCYTVFSGGDDLFLVGPWDEIVRLADRIRDDFAKYTGNPEMTLSAGVFIGKFRFPIARASGNANELLERAKNGGRSAVTILNYSMPWDKWKLVEKQWHNLQPHTGRISSAFLYSLLRYGRMWQDYKIFRESKGEKGDVLGLRFQPLLAYNLARNLSRRDNPEIYEWTQKLIGLRPNDAEQGLVLDNLVLIATLLILSKEGGSK
jgi:CRISPR-associated protein Csm1